MPLVRALGLDAVCVLVFVVIGRATHEGVGGPVDIAGTAWPFLVALAAGWAVLRAWRTPDALATGAGIWAVTLVAGMGLRAVAGQGTAAAFVVVACLFLAATLLGWRLALWALRRRSRASSRARSV